MFVRSVIQVVLGRPRDILPSTFPSISFSYDVLFECYAIYLSKCVVAVSLDKTIATIVFSRTF